MTLPADDSAALTPLGSHELMDRVGDVLRRAAGAGDPRAVSRDQFNAARDAGVPSAQAVCKRLKRSWREVVPLALGAVSDRQGRGKRGRGNKRRSNDVERDFPDELIHVALQACAFALDHVPSPHEFDAWASAQAAQRERRGMLANPLPHSSTIISRLGDWPAALVAAGIVERAEQVDHHAGLRVKRPVAETLDDFIDEVGILPTRHYFEDWCRRKDIPVGRDARDWKAAVAAVRTRRAAAGKATPAEMTMPKDAPPLPDPVPRANRGTKGTIQWDKDRILDALRYYQRTYLTDGRAPTQKHYLACAKGDPKLPASSTLTRKGEALGWGFQDWCRAAGL